MKILYENVNGCFISDTTTPGVVVKVENPARVRSLVDREVKIDGKPSIPNWAKCCGWG